MKRRPDQKQFLIDWSNPAPAHGGDASDRKGEGTQSHPGQVPYQAQCPSPASPIQHLPWDFKTTFPQPTEEAIATGVIDDTDLDADNLRSLHEEHANAALEILRRLDHFSDCRRRGLDPRTGKPPRTHASRERARRAVDDEIPRLEHAFDVLMDVYEDAFGGEAADAFRKATRAWHGGVEVRQGRGR